MRSSMLRPFLIVSPLILALGCGSSDDDDEVNTAFKLRNTPHGVAAATPLVADRHWLAYLASEATTGAGGTDYNGDGDKIDPIAVRVNTISNAKRVLNVATQAMAFAKRTLFLVVSEAADGTDWSNPADGDTADTVLLYHRPGDATATFLAEVSGAVGTAMVAIDDLVFFVSATAPAAAGDTDLFVVEVATAGGAPSTPTRVTTSIVDVNADGVSVAPLRLQEGLLFLTIDENADGELNGDGDDTDSQILALLDATDTGNAVLGTELAVDAGAPTDVYDKGNDWLVAFLVDETDQNENLNDVALFGGEGAAWQPTNCFGIGDIDMSDDVLHWLLYSDFLAGGSPVNTGLVGSSTEFVYAHRDDFVGVTSLEADEGTGTGCDLNGDLDMDDRIFRWVDASNPLGPVLPVTDASKLMALVTTIPGRSADSTGAVIPLAANWVILVDEAADGRDHDGDAGDDNVLVAAHNPTNVGTGWNFDHGSQNAGPVNVTWMARDPQNATRFLAALSEDVIDIDLNNDGDKFDSVPTFPTSHNGTILKFPGYGIAVDASNAGIVGARGVGFYRLSENDEQEDWNGDGDMADAVLQRIGLTTNDLPTLMGTLNNEDLPAVSFEVGTPQFGALLFQETLQGVAGKDLNGDGDATDFVVRYFRMPE